MTGTCPTCGQQFSRGPHAVYCSRKCKARASELRRRARHPDRDRDRYHRESDRRREYAREYSRANLSVGVVRRRNRKDRKRGNPGFAPFSPAEWQAGRPTLGPGALTAAVPGRSRSTTTWCPWPVVAGTQSATSSRPVPGAISPNTRPCWPSGDT